ncbi:MAG: flavin reductase family protein, partial [Thermoanaerobaculia bacterium]|nr:flavin reductase family protein [Thermoanaerobaculia bacterium]
MTIDQASFRTAMSHFPCGVTVVTTKSDEGPAGLTVSSFCSLSLDPPLVLVCIDKGVASHVAISSSGRFAVNILTEEQEDVSRTFASRLEDKFAGVGTRDGIGAVPLIEGSLAIVECSVH